MTDELDAADSNAAAPDTAELGHAQSPPHDALVSHAHLRRFKLLRPLGAGGMGVVYEAYDMSTRCNVALKTLRRGSDDPRVLKREFRAAAALSHLNLVVLYELFAEHAEVYFTMELVHGVDLLQFLHRGPHAANETAGQMVQLLPGIIDALEYLHAQGLVHGDLKPGNILVADGGRPVVLDFGLTRALCKHEGHEEADSQLAGTPQYMAPELWSGQPRTPASDWYAIGVLLCSVLNADLPTQSHSTAAAVPRALRTSPTRSEPAALDPILQKLCEGLLLADPRERFGAGEARAALQQLTGSGISLPRRSTDSAQAPLVGRETELISLARALRASRERMQVFVVHGVSGIGKTALLRHFMMHGQVASAGMHTFAWLSTCHERERFSYKVLESLLEQIAHGPPLDAASLSAAEIEALTQVFPAFRAQLPDKSQPPHAVDARQLRRQASRALRVLLHQLSARGPVVIAFDDLQWGDLDSIAVLEEVFDPRHAPPILLIAGVRSENLRKSAVLNAFFDLPAVRGGTRIELGPLDTKQAHQLAADTIGAMSTQLAQLVQQAEGHPMLVIELARFFAAQQTSSAAPPRSLDALLQSRIERVRPAARAQLEIVALARGPISKQAAREAVGTGEDYSVALHELRSARLIRSDGPLPSDTVEVLHDRIREVVLTHVEEARAAHIHLRLAQALERQEEADHEVLYWHYREAGEPTAAAQNAQHAAQTAQSNFAFDRAARLYEAAFALDPRQRSVSGLRALGDCLRHAGQGARAAAAYTEAALCADHDTALELRRLAALQLLTSGDLRQGEAQIAQLLAEVGVSYPRTTLGAFAGLVWRRLQIARTSSVTPLRAAHDVEPALLRKIDTVWAASQGIFMIDVARGARLAADAHIAALQAGEPHRLACSLATEATNLAYRGPQHTQDVAALMREAQRVAGHSSDPHTALWLQLMDAVAVITQGDLVAGLARCVALEVVLERHQGDAWWERATNRNLLLTALFRLGRFGEFAPRIEPAVRGARARGNHYELVMLRLWRVVESLAAADVDGATHHADAILREWPGHGFQMQHYHHFVAKLMVLIYMGAAREAWQFAERTWPRWRLSMTPMICMEAALSWNLRGTAALAWYRSSRDERARRVVLRCAAWLDRSPYPTASASAALLRGGLCTGDEASRWFASAECELSQHDRSAAAASAAWAHAESSALPRNAVIQRFQILGVRDANAMRRLWIS